MESDKERNSFTILQMLMLIESMEMWDKHPEKPFLACWKSSLRNSKYCNWDSEEERELWLKKFSRDFLNSSTNILSNFSLVQLFIYAYENINKNYEQFEGADKNKFAKLKRKFLTGNLNNDQILNVIRQSVAHNDDQGIPNFAVNFNDDRFHFCLNNSPQKIDITIEELLDVMDLYMKYSKGMQTEGFEVVYKFDAIADNRYSNPGELMFLRDRKNKKMLLPDEYQGKAILNYAKECREWEFVVNKLNPYYPFKNNNWLNTVNVIGAKVFINLLSEKRYLNFNEMFLSSTAQSDSILSSCTNILQPMSLLYSNLLFLIFSSTNIEDVKHCADCENIIIDVRRIRNAIMHGTYFYDCSDGFEFYDGPIKDEEKLVHVGTLSFKDISQLGRRVSTCKVKNNQERYEYGLTESGFIETLYLENNEFN